MAAADNPAADPNPDDWQARCATLLADAEAALAGEPAPARLQAALAACDEAAALARARLPAEDSAETRTALTFGFSPRLAALATAGGEQQARDWLARAVALRERIATRAGSRADAGQASPDAVGRAEARSPTAAPESGHLASVQPKPHEHASPVGRAEAGGPTPTSFSYTISGLPSPAPPKPTGSGAAEEDEALWQQAFAQFIAAETAYHRGDPCSLREAIQAADAGIALARRVDLSNPERIHNLATAYHYKGFALRNIGTADTIDAAVQAHNAAIDLLRRLAADDPAHRTHLAGSHVNKGVALAARKRPDDLAAAIAEYDEAIRLLSPVCAEPHAEAGVLSFLSNAHNNKALVLTEISTAVALAEAVRACDAAIELRNCLDLDIPEYRNGLASAHSSKGGALQAIGTPAALADAVRAYDTAIALRSRLDLDIPEYRNDLASVHSNKGGALQAIGTPAALADAVRACDAAIALRSRLDLDIPKYRKDLADAHINRGLALAWQGTPEAMTRALADYQTGIDLLPDDLALAWHPAADFKANGYINLSSTLAALGRPVDAEDAAEQSLSLLQRLEANGQYALRAKREQHFRHTLNLARAANQHPILPELALEHLDPEVPGSAPASAAMHRAALEVLRQALADVLQMPQADALLAEYGAAFARLAEIRERWFGGTATAAELRAQDAELRGDVDAARGIVAEYLAARPRDPEGWRVLADLCRRLGDGPGQEAALTELGRRLVHAGTTPPADGRGGGGARRRCAAATAPGAGPVDALLPQVAAAELDDALGQLLATTLGWQRWLIRDYPDAVLAPPADDDYAAAGAAGGLARRAADAAGHRLGVGGAGMATAAAAAHQRPRRQGPRRPAARMPATRPITAAARGHRAGAAGLARLRRGADPCVAGHRRRHARRGARPGCGSGRARAADGRDRRGPGPGAVRHHQSARCRGAGGQHGRAGRQGLGAMWGEPADGHGAPPAGRRPSAEAAARHGPLRRAGAGAGAGDGAARALHRPAAAERRRGAAGPRGGRASISRR
jgi:tetratricopeptide (TPR) repeat protein